MESDKQAAVVNPTERKNMTSTAFISQITGYLLMAGQSFGAPLELTYTNCRKIPHLLISPWAIHPVKGK